MIKVKDGYAKLIGVSALGAANQVLLSNGGNLGYAISSTASTLVLRNTNGLIESSLTDKAPFKISSAVVNTNLNADLLDGVHKEGLLTAVSSSETDNLSITVGGTTKTITNLHAHYLDTLGNKAATDLSSTYPKGLSVAGISHNGSWPFYYGAAITANGNGGYFLIAGQWNSSVTSTDNCDFPTEMYIRGRRDSYDVWTTWTKVLTNRNSSVSGGGSSVGSSITVNIGGTSKTLTIPSTSSYTNYLKIHDVRGTNHLPNSTTYPEQNIAAWFNNTGTPNGSWWSGITVKGWANTHAVWQLCSYSSTGTDNNYSLYLRNGINGDWGSWKTILDSSNYKSIIGSGAFWKVNGQTTVGTGDIYLEMWRGANASWKMLNTGGVLKFLSNYTTAAGSYYDALTVTYNTGNVWAKGNITSATGVHNSNTTLYLDSASTTTSIIFRHGTTERMRIALPDGYVGIGTSSPTARLHVAGLVNITANSGTLTIGSLNTLYTHYHTTGGTHWFNKAVAINGNHYPHVTNSFSSGTSGYRWSNVYSLLGNFAGTVSINCAWPNIVCNNNASDATESNIRFEVGGTNKGYVGFVNFYGTYLYNSSAAKYVYIANNGYFYTQSYINVGAGNEKNASNPPYVWGVNGSDNFMRTYATSSLSVGMAANADYAISSPAMANYGGTGSTTKIKIKINSTISWMLSFVVTIYLGYKSSKIMVSGYNYGSSHWHEPEAVLLGDSNGATSIPVYFGYDSNWNLWVGFDGGDYTGVSISDVTNGYAQISSLKGLFTISNVSSLTTLQKTVTAVNSINYAATANVANYTTRLYANSTTNLITKPGDYSLAYSRFLAGASHIFPTGNNANGVITAHLHSGEYYAQIGLSSNGRMYYRTMMGQTLDAGVEWNKVAFSTDTMSYITVTNSDANSTYRMVWHSENILYSTAGIYCNPSTDYLYASSMNASNWFRSSGNTGWHNPTNECYVYPNNVSTYGGLILRGTKGSYHGFLLGTTANYMTVMSTDTHHGLYCDNAGLWEFYYNRSSKAVGILTSTITKTINLAGSTYISSTLDMGGAIYTASTPGSWVSGMSGAAILYRGLSAIDASSFWRFFNMKSSGGHVVCYGGLGNDIGFYGYYSGRTENGTDWRFTVSTANGNWTATASIYAAHFYENSDIMLKTNILEILRSDNIPTIKEFDWKEDGSHSYGLIAQELEELGYSELVSVKDDGYKTVNYSAALSLIVGKLQVKIKELEKEIENLKNKN